MFNLLARLLVLCLLVGMVAGCRWGSEAEFSKFENDFYDEWQENQNERFFGKQPSGPAPKGWRIDPP